MKKFIFGLIVGVALMAGAVWYIGSRNMDVNARTKVTDEPGRAAAQTKEFVREKMDALDLAPDKIKDEMASMGKVVRTKQSNGARAMTDASVDAGTTVAIQSKFGADAELSPMNLSVSTSGGVVTLSGTAASPANIRKAIQLAWDTDGVNQVISTIAVKQ